MKPTINKIAEKAGVSRGTVDRVLNNRGKVKPEVDAKVRDIAKTLGYVTKTQEKENRKRSSKIGVITFLSETDFMQDINKGIFQAAAEMEQYGISVILKEGKTVDADEQLQFLDEMEKEGVSGLAIMPVSDERINEKLSYLISEKKIPVVTFNTDVEGIGRSCFIGMDNRQSGRAAAGLMNMLTGGVGSLLIITGYFTNALSGSRLDGFVETLRTSGSNLTVAGVQSSLDDPKEVEKIVLDHYSRNYDLAGIFIASSGQDGIRWALDKLKLKKRPGIIVYDCTPGNVEALRNGEIDFIIDQNTYFQGYHAVHTLAGIILGGTAPESEYLYTEINIKTKYTV